MSPQPPRSREVGVAASARTRSEGATNWSPQPMRSRLPTEHEGVGGGAPTPLIGAPQLPSSREGSRAGGTPGRLIDFSGKRSMPALETNRSSEVTGLPFDGRAILHRDAPVVPSVLRKGEVPRAIAPPGIPNKPSVRGLLLRLASPASESLEPSLYLLAFRLSPTGKARRMPEAKNGGMTHYNSLKINGLESIR